MRNLKRVLSLALALVMVLGMMVITTSAADFTDADEITNTEAVDVISAIGVINGMGDGSFRPTETLTREQGAALICYLLMGKENADKLAGSGNFTDVPASRWSAGAIDYCVSLGLIKGVGDNKFNPTGELTAVAYGRLLLGALGYDGDIEGYTGANWASAIATDMIEAGLDVNGVAMDAQLTREQAAQMTLQALESAMVYYPIKGTSITIDGVSINTGSSVATATGKTFMGKYYEDLKKVAGDPDKYGRPADHAWELDGKTVCTVYKKAVATYTNTFTEKVVEGLEKQKYSFADNIIYNGDVLATTVGGSIPAGVEALYVPGSGAAINGYTVELYNTDNNAKTIEVIVVTEGYFATIEKFTAAKGQAAAKVEVKVYEAGNTKTMTITDDPDEVDLYDTLAAYKKGDAIMVYCANEWEKNLNDASYILDVEDVTAVEGQITKVNVGTYNNNTTVVIGGTTYPMNSQCVGGKALTAGLKGALYLDAEGYAIGWVGEKNEVETEYAYVLAVKTDIATSTFGKAIDMAQLLLADGTVVEAEYELADGATELKTGDKDIIVEYSVDEDGVYTLSDVTENTNVTSVTTNKATLASGVYADGKTVFVISNGKTPASYTVYTGIANAPTLTGVTSSAVVEKNHAEIVFVTASTTKPVSAEKAIFVTNTGAQETKELAADGKTVITYYLQKAVVEGEITTIKTQTKLNGVYTSITTDKNGVVTVATPATTSEVTAVVEYVNGVLNIDGGYRGYVDTAVCYIADKTTGVITEGTIENLSADDTYTGWFTQKDGIVTGLYLIG